MAVNLYDSPAQAQFINTYVPIQFEGLYKVAEKAQKNLDEIEALQDEVISKYSTINTPSKIDKVNYEARYNQIRDWTNKKITSGESLKDPVLQSEYKSMVRRFAGDTLIRDILDNAKTLKEYAKNSDPRFGDYERNIAATFDSRTGMFDKSNIKYQSWNELGKDSFSLLKPELIGTSKDGYQDLYGISDESVKKTARETATLLERDPSVRVRIEAEAAMDPGAVNYMTDGKLDYKRYAEDKLYSAYGEMSGIHDKKANFAWEQYQFRTKRADAAAANKKNDPGTPYSELVRAEAKQLSDNKSEQLFQSHLDNMGVNGSKYKWSRNTLAKVNSKLATMATSDPGYAALFKEKQSLETAIPAYEAAARANFEIEKTRAINGKSKIFTKGQILDIQNVSLDPAAVDRWAEVRYGASGDVTFGTSEKRRVRQPSISTDFEVIDPSNGLPIKNTGGFTREVRVAADQINNYLRNGSLAGKILFEATSNGHLSGDSSVKNTGFAFVLKSQLEALSPDIRRNINGLIKSGVFRSKSIVKRQEDLTKTTGGTEISDEYIEIPVSSEITQTLSRGNLTQSEFNALTGK